MQIQNSCILITGGTLGIGKQTAKLLIQKGAKVAITGRNEQRTLAAAEEIGAFPIIADVSKNDDVSRTFKEYFNKFDKLDCLINNAGIGVHKPLLELSEHEMRDVWEVNVIGAMLMAKNAAEHFVKQNYGNIINIASTSGLKGYEKGTAYVASKFALRGMTECWRAELRKNNIRVILINPSEVPTAFGSPERKERSEEPQKLTTTEIAHAIIATLEMDDRGFIPELSVFATNPWG